MKKCRAWFGWPAGAIDKEPINDKDDVKNKMMMMKMKKKKIIKKLRESK